MAKRKKMAMPGSTIGYALGHGRGTPTLGTSRLILVPYLASMVHQRHVDWLNDPETVKYSEQRHKQHTVESQHKYLNDFPAGSHIWLIRAKTETTVDNWHHIDIGTITAYIDEPNKLANMGILIAKEHQGQGAGREAWQAVMKFLKAAGIEKIECGVRYDNIAMNRLAQASGMEYEGQQLRHFKMDARTRGAVRYFGWSK